MDYPIQYTYLHIDLQELRYVESLFSRSSTRKVNTTHEKCDDKTDRRVHNVRFSVPRRGGLQPVCMITAAKTRYRSAIIMHADPILPVNVSFTAKFICEEKLS